MLRPTFLGFETQKRALFSAQKNLDITGNNISNIDTKGYTRQRVDLFSVENQKGGLRYDTKVALAGQGVDMYGVTQIRNVLLDERYRTISGEANESTTKADILYNIEDIIDDVEAANTGFSGIMSKFEKALQDFSTENADRREMAAVAINAAKQIGNILQNFSNRINKVSDLTYTKTENAVDRVNQIFKQISSLNKQIVDDYVASNQAFINDSGKYQAHQEYGALELKDQRNLLLDELAEYGDVEVTTNLMGDITVKFGGKEVVSKAFFDVNGNKVGVDADGNPVDPKAKADYVYAQLSMFKPTSGTPEEKQPSNLKLYASELFTRNQWISIASDPAKSDAVLGAQKDASGNVSNEIINVGTDNRNTTSEGLSRGTLKAYFDMYNGNGSFVSSAKYKGAAANGYQGIPYYKEVMNSLAKTFADKFNEANGYDSADPNTAHRQMFTYDPDDAAYTFAVSQAWKDNTMMVGMTTVQEGTDKEHQELDNENLHRLLGVFKTEFTYDSIPSGQKYTLEGYVRNYGESIGEQTESEINAGTVATTILSSIDSARDDIMGVFLDEEGINMMNYQKWYNAAARMMTTLDEALDTIINSMGIVGR